MKVILLAKQGKPGVEKASRVLNELFDRVVCYISPMGTPFPKGLLNMKPDILISYLSPWIVPECVLANTKFWNLNFHPGPPEYPGTGCYNFALYHGVRSYGVTAHVMEPKVDTGNIVGVRRFKVSARETVQTLAEKSYVALEKLFVSVMTCIKETKSVPELKVKWLRRPYKRAELESLCEIDLSMSGVEVAKRIRATYFPGKPGPYLKFHDYFFAYSPVRG